MIILNYPTKKALKESIGQPLKYTETSVFGPEYVPNGELYGSNRPRITGNGKVEFYAKVVMKDGKIRSVS